MIVTKSGSRLLTVLFCGFLGVFFLWHLALPDREKSPVENRTLAQWPEFSWASLIDGSYTEAAEKYFADQFPLRDQWTGLKARMEQLLGKREFHNVYLCGDTLISKVAAPDEKLVEQNLSYFRRFAEGEEIPVHLGLIPSAAAVWKEKLPAGAESWEQEKLLAQGEALELSLIGFSEALTAHAQEPIFYRTDHHWTSLGAFYGANALLNDLGIEPLKENDFTPKIASENFNGTLYSTSGIHWLAPDTIEFWVEEQGLSVESWRTGRAEESTLYQRSYLQEKDQYSAFLGGNQPLCVIKNETLPQGEKLLLVRDSYGDSLAPFLAQRFSEVHLLDLRYYRNSVSAYAAENGIDQIAVVYSIQNFIADRNLVLLTR